MVGLPTSQPEGMRGSKRIRKGVSTLSNWKTQIKAHKSALSVAHFGFSRAFKKAALQP
jgi:hypothetical protein